MQMQENFERAANYIRTAASEGAELAVLPEYALTGWVPTDPKFSDEAEDLSWLQRFSVGFITRLDTEKMI